MDIRGMFRLPWLFTTLLFCYVPSALLLMQILNLRPPEAVEIAISIYIAPIHFIFRPLYPLLKPLGLLKGEYWKLPSLLGFLLGTVVYGAFCLAVGSAIKLLRR